MDASRARPGDGDAPGGPSRQARHAPRDAAATASAVDEGVDVGRRRARPPLEARARHATHEDGEVHGRAEQRGEGDVVPSDGDDEDVVFGDVVSDEGVLGEESTPRAVVQGGGLHRRVQAPEALALALSLLVDPVAHVALHAGRLEDGLVPVHRVRPGREPVLVVEAGIAREEDDRVVPPPKRGERQGEMLDVVPVEGLVVRSHLIIVQGRRVHRPMPRQ